MDYYLRYLIYNQYGSLTQFGPEQILGELPNVSYGYNITVEGVTYRVGSIPYFKQKEEFMLIEILLVNEEGFERQQATGRVPVASIEKDFNLNGATEWGSTKLV